MARGRTLDIAGRQPGGIRWNPALIFDPVLGTPFGPAGNPSGAFGGGVFGDPFGPVQFVDSFQESPATTDLVAGRDAVKWPTAAYLTGAAPGLQFDGTGRIVGVNGVGPPTVRMYSLPIAINYQKPHSLLWEGCGLDIFSGGQQSSLGFGMHCDASPATGLINYSWNGGLTGDTTGVNFTLNLNGALVTLTGAQYSALAGASIKVTVGQWDGAQRTVKTFFNGTQIDSRSLTVLPSGTQNRLRFVWSNAQAVGNPNILAGKITFRGFT